MKTKNLWATLLITSGFAFLGTSCSSDSDSTFSSTSDAALAVTVSDESQASTVNDEIVTEADLYLNTVANSGYQAVSSGYQAVKAETDTVTGPTITISRPDSVTFPKTITIDFGTTGFTGKRGNILKGKIIVIVSNKMWKENSSKTITFDNFYVNDNKVVGSKTVTYKGLNTNNHPYWTVSANDTITRTDGSTVIWISERTRERVDDNGTPLNLSDDKYSITGSSSGVNAKGVAYTQVIDENNPLIIYNNYPHFVQGIVTITSDKRTATLNYGDGTKDNKATITINDVTKNVTLKN